MRSITEKCSSISALQKRWIKWQKETWDTPKEQALDLQDAGISVEERTVREWRKGSLPRNESWAIINIFGWNLLSALFGDALLDTYHIQQREIEETH